ncbi:UNVERIFIED_CONTAM: hypothetical protein HHA_285930 [Hammondia hammondi]|eukprot:XP_008884153.1 hypothetical protein HHA_285930 [Hammondia hammondi]
MRIQNQLPPPTHQSGSLTWWQWPLRLLDAVLSGYGLPLALRSRKGNSLIEQVLVTILCAVLVSLLLRKLITDYRVDLMWQQFLENLTEALAVNELDISHIQRMIRSELSSPQLSGKLRSRHAYELFQTLRLRQDMILTQDLSAVASEVAALGVPVDLALLRAETKRPQTTTDTARRALKISDWVRMGPPVRTLLLHIASICRLFMHTMQEASDIIFNDPASSLVALCI